MTLLGHSHTHKLKSMNTLSKFKEKVKSEKTIK